MHVTEHSLKGTRFTGKFLILTLVYIYHLLIHAQTPSFCTITSSSCSAERREEARKDDPTTSMTINFIQGA